MLGKHMSTPNMAESSRDGDAGIKNILEQTFVPYMEQVLEYLGLE